MSAREWTFPAGPTEAGAALVQSLGVSSLVAESLVSRGVPDEAGARRFLAPDVADLLEPFLFPAMEEACARVHAAVRNQEPIVVYGDYDVDGMTSATLLYWVLRRLGATCEIYIPDRASSGYGLNRDAILNLRSRGVTLLITVDNGISAVDEIAYAAEQGVSVIVTDHHTLPATLPRAAILLHPRLPGREYPFPHLCGAGVAYKFGLALLATSALPDREVARQRFASNCVDVVAIGTIADMAPLVGENRILVREGLKQLSRSEHPGLRALLGIDRLLGQRLTTEHVGFKICPKINAAGRIDDHRLALDLLLARDPASASRLALKLAQVNHERIRLVTELMARVATMQEGWAARMLPVVVLETDKKGLVGLIAQKLKEMHHKPFLVLASDGTTATGSGRSVDGFDLVEALTAQQSFLTRFGGHAMAVGFTIDCRRIAAFAESIDAHAGGQLRADPTPPPVAVDAVLSPEGLTAAVLSDLEMLAPFGQGNRAPLLALRRVPVSRVDKLGEGGHHVRLHSPALPPGVKNVGFRLSAEVESALAGTSHLDLAFHLEMDSWAGRESLQMKLQAIRPALG